MDVAYQPVPLRCVLMTISMGVLLILLCAGPACTHKNRGSKGGTATMFPALEIPLLTQPPTENSARPLPPQKVPELHQLPWPPRDSWLLFLKNSDRTISSKRKSQDTPKYRRPGPIGPPAPPRHLTHHVNPMTQEKKLQRFLHLLRAELLQKKQNWQQNPDHELPSKVHAAFICRTNMDTSVEPGAQQEVQLYELPEEEGSFYRGYGLNLTSGRYTAPFCGLYSFSARLQIRFEAQPKMDTKGFLHAQLCIQSLCQQHLSLEAKCVTGNEDPHKVTLNGVLYLQAGQYVSIYLKNKIGSQLVVEKGSSFSGVLLGV